MNKIFCTVEMPGGRQAVERFYTRTCNHTNLYQSERKQVFVRLGIVKNIPKANDFNFCSRLFGDKSLA